MGDQLNGGSVDCPDIHSGVIQVMNTNDNDDNDNDISDDDDGDDSPESYAPAYAITTPVFCCAPMQSLPSSVIGNDDNDGCGDDHYDDMAIMISDDDDSNGEIFTRSPVPVNFSSLLNVSKDELP